MTDISINDLASKTGLDPKLIAQYDKNKNGRIDQKEVKKLMDNKDAWQALAAVNTPAVKPTLSPEAQQEVAHKQAVQDKNARPKTSYIDNIGNGAKKGGIAGAFDKACSPIDSVGTAVAKVFVGDAATTKTGQKLTKAFSRGITFALIGFAIGGPIGGCLGFLIGFISGIFSKSDTSTTNPNPPTASEGDSPKPEQNSEGQPKEGAKVPIPGNLNAEKPEKNEIPLPESKTPAETEKPAVTSTDSTPEKPKPVTEAEQKVKEATGKLAEAKKLAEEAAAKKAAADKTAKEVADKVVAAKTEADKATPEKKQAAETEQKKAEEKAARAKKEADEAAAAKDAADKAMVEAERMLKEATTRLNILRAIPSNININNKLNPNPTHLELAV